MRENATSIQARGNVIVNQRLPIDDPPQPAVAPEAVWNVVAPVATFTARDIDLVALTAALDVHQPVGSRVVLHGIPGVGKTQLALAWIHRQADELQIAWQIRAADRLTVVADLAQLADQLGLVSYSDQEQAAIAVVAELGRRQGWLLLFDDATSDTVRGLVPSRHGYVLLTSRSPNWAVIAAAQEVGLFPPQAAATFLDPAHEPSLPVAAQLAEQLGYLPLALEQARAYCAATGRSLDDYLDAFKQQRLLRHGIDENLHPTVVATVGLALSAATDHSSAAAQLMRLWAHFAPTPIPRDLAVNASQQLPEPLRHAVCDAPTFDAAVKALSDLALVTVRDGTVRVHQLVGELLRDGPLPRQAWWQRLRLRPVRVKWPDVAVRALQAALPEDVGNPASWDTFAMLLPHVLAAVGQTTQLDAEGTRLATNLLDSCAHYLYLRGEYDDARQLLENALTWSRRVLGNRDLDVLRHMIHLGNVLRHLGELESARRLHERALETYRPMLGDEHPRTLAAMNNLADMLLLTGGELGHALELSEHASEACRRLLGDKHPITLVVRSTLADVLREMGELEHARQLHDEVLDTRRQVIGADHPDTLNSMESLANVLHNLGELQGARHLQEHALIARRRVLGDDHPLTLRSMNALSGMNEVIDPERKGGRVADDLGS